MTVFELLEKIYNDEKDLPKKIKVHNEVYIRNKGSVNYFEEKDYTDLLESLAEFNTYSLLHFSVEEFYEAKEVQKEKWEPKNGEEYLYIAEEGYIYRDHWEDNSSIDKFRYSIKNCFKTEEEAKNRLENIKTEIELRQLAEKLNDKTKINWEDDKQDKYYLSYNYNRQIVDYNITWTTKQAGTIYCLDENFEEKAIEKIGEVKLINYLKEE